MFGGEHLTPWLLLPWLSLPLAAPIDVRTVRNKVDGPSLNGALARTGMLQLAFCVLLSAGLLLSQVIALSVRTERFTLPSTLRASWGELREREVLVVRLDFPDGLWGEGEAAPLEPYDGVSMGSVRAALDVYAEVLAAGWSRRPTCWRPVAPSGTCPRRWRRSTSPCGTTRRAAPGHRWRG